MRPNRLAPFDAGGRWCRFRPTLLAGSPGGPGTIRGLRPSPDGQTLAFGYCPPGEPDRLVLLPAQGGELQEVVEGTFNDIAWMPAGNALVACGSLDGREEGVFYVDLVDGDVHPIGIAGGIGRGMDVHPDGHRIAYPSGTTSNELWMMENLRLL